MHRRYFLKLAGVGVAGLAFAGDDGVARASEAVWRTFEVTTHVQVLRPDGATRVWLPRPLLRETPFQRNLSFTVECETGKVRQHDDNARESLGVVMAEFAAGAPAQLVTRARVATRNWSVDLAGSDVAPRRVSAEQQSFLQPTLYVPTDGIVRQKAMEITSGARTDLEKARAIYEWVVENTHRDPKLRGCGVGDIRPMLETGDLGGKCADLNALYVGLAKAAGLPARDVYGIRVGTFAAWVQEPGDGNRDDHESATLPR